MTTMLSPSLSRSIATLKHNGFARPFVARVESGSCSRRRSMHASSTAGCISTWKICTWKVNCAIAHHRPVMAKRAFANELIVGLVSISDRASQGVYVDQGLPGLQQWFERALRTPLQMHQRLIADDRSTIERTLIELIDDVGCDLVLTTGGTGPSRRDVTPEATLAVAEKEMPGFGEQMRAVSLKYVPTAILSRQVAVIRKQALIINLPGQPKAIKETLDGVFAAVPYCICLLYTSPSPRDS